MFIGTIVWKKPSGDEMESTDRAESIAYLEGKGYKKVKHKKAKAEDAPAPRRGRPPQSEVEVKQLRSQLEDARLEMENMRQEQERMFAMLKKQLENDKDG